MAEILRFVVSRPVQLGRDKLRTPATAKAYPDGESDLVQRVRSAQDRNAARKILRDWLDSPAHDLDSAIALMRLTESVAEAFASDVHIAGAAVFVSIDALAKAAGLPSWHDGTQTKELGEFQTILADRLFAQTLLGGAAARGAYRTIRLIRSLALIVATVRAGSRGLPRVEVDRLMRIRPLLPALSGGDDSDASTSSAPASSRSGDAGIRRQEREKERARIRGAIKAMYDLAALLEREDDRVNAAAPERLTAARLFGTTRPKPEARPPAASWLDRLPRAHSDTIGAAIADASSKSLSTAIDDMEAHLRRVSSPFVTAPANAAGMRLRYGGAAVLSRNHFGAGAAAPALDAQPTVPSGIGELGALHRGDLVIVRQRLARYELGEIAHVENVLQGESQERSFARNTTTEATLVSSRETTMSEERDNQTTERFELSSAMREAVDDHLKLEAGVSVSASYGPTVGVQVNSESGYDHARQQSKEVASSFAREVSSSAKSKVETRVSEQRAARNLTEVRELTRHVIDNSGGGAHVRGLYRWVNKVYEMQVVNYGMRDLYDFYVPEPAAFVRHVNGLKAEEPLDIPEPVAPTVTDEEDGELRPLTPDDINEWNYAKLVAQTGARDVAAPPAATQVISAVIQCSVEGDKPASTVNSELVIPEGYQSTALKFNGAGHRSGNDYFWYLEISGRNFTGRDSKGGPSQRGDELNFGGRVGKVPVAVVSDGYDQLVVTLWMRVTCTAGMLQAWQLGTYAAIMQGFQAQKAAYDETRAAARGDMQAQIAGRAGAANLDLIRNELKRAVITLMTAQRFERFDSMRAPSARGAYPEIALADARAEGRYVAFVEQAFEWENMTYVLYPYFWGRKAEWTVTSRLDDVDDRFAKFLRAGFGRVQVPVRPGYEALVSFTFDPGNWSGDLWNQPDPPGFDRDGAMSIEDEMKSQTGGLDHVQGAGRISFQANATLVTGVDTAFTEDDEDRELRVDMVTYRIVAFIDATQVRIEGPGPSTAVNAALYTLGPKLVGPPWELGIPTTLVYLQDDAQLNI